jgi:hypothetical protein
MAKPCGHDETVGGCRVCQLVAGDGIDPVLAAQYRALWLARPPAPPSSVARPGMALSAYQSGAPPVSSPCPWLWKRARGPGGEILKRSCGG